MFNDSITCGRSDEPVVVEGQGAVEEGTVPHDHAPAWTSVHLFGAIYPRPYDLQVVLALADRQSLCATSMLRCRKMLFVELPTEILANILQMLAYRDILSCREVRIYPFMTTQHYFKLNTG